MSPSGFPALAICPYYIDVPQECTRIFSAAALSGAMPAEADRILDLLLECGVKHIDAAALYGDAELRIAPWMARHRQDFFRISSEPL